MKTKDLNSAILILLLLAFIIPVNAQPTMYNLYSTTPLAISNGINYTEGHFYKSLRFLEFVLGTQITDEELQQGVTESINEFYLYPYQSIQQVEEVDLQMQRVYQLTEPTQIGLVRSAMLSQLFAAVQNIDELPFMFQLMNKYTPLLALDVENMLAFTEPDFQGYLKMMNLNAQATGQYFEYTDQELEIMRVNLSKHFNSSSLPDKQSMCVMSVLAEYMTKVYEQMSLETQNAWQNQILNQQAYQYQGGSMDDAFQQGYNLQQEQSNYDVQWPTGVNTTAEKQVHLQQMRTNMNANAASWDIMNDVNMNTNAVMLNTIENFGDTGNYWEVKYNDY